MRLNCSKGRSMREREGSKAKPIFHFELVEYRGQVVPHCGLSDPELPRNFLILQTATNQWYDLKFPFGQLLDTLLCIGRGQPRFAVESRGFQCRDRQVFAGVESRLSQPGAGAPLAEKRPCS